jgi:hypothetical protein
LELRIFLQATLRNRLRNETLPFGFNITSSVVRNVDNVALEWYAAIKEMKGQR